MNVQPTHRENQLGNVRLDSINTGKPLLTANIDNVS